MAHSASCRARQGDTQAAGWLVGGSMRKRAVLFEWTAQEKVRVKTFYNQRDAPIKRG